VIRHRSQRSPPSGRGDAVEKTEHGLEGVIAVDDCDVETGYRSVGAARAKFPLEAALIVVPVDRTCEAEREVGEL
jgi:hypothetical protein